MKHFFVAEQVQEKNQPGVHTLLWEYDYNFSING